LSASVGPAIIDVEGTVLGNADRARLRHPAAGGVILFSRNYQEPAQLLALVGEIRALRRELLICVDHEGGRVQRFRAGFTPLPAMRRVGALWDRDRSAARAAARAAGVVVAAELAEYDVDFSFAPVLDLDYGKSTVIGDRAFHADPLAVGELAAAFIAGLGDCGMAAVGKHFPGHGYAADPRAGCGALSPGDRRRARGGDAGTRRLHPRGPAASGLFELLAAASAARATGIRRTDLQR
jgi:beta-N-acetylhexosaminidase